MKKKLLLCVSVLLTNFLMAQETVKITGPAGVEVGIPYNYTFEFVPDYNMHTNTTTGVVPDGFVITEWIVTTGSSCYNGQVIGYIGNSTNQSCYYNNATFNSPSPLTVPIQWGDGTFLRDDKVQVKVSGYYIKKDSGANMGYFTYLKNELSITVNRIVAPIIAGSTSLLSCDQAVVNYSVSNTTYANRFDWQVTNGATIIGASTNSIVYVKPPITGDFDVICIARSLNANPNYFKSSSKTITRVSRALSFVTSPVQDFICKDSGLVFQYADQSGLSNVSWNAPNCTVSVESIANGMRQVTIYPNSSATIGSSITISATANFTGGCTAVSSSKSFKILDGTTATMPAGYFNVTLPENESSICTTPLFDISFVSTNGFNNGITTLSQNFIWGPGDELHYKINKPTAVTVCNKNLCTGLSTCKVFNVYPPAPCESTARLAATESVNGTFTVAPNPTNGSVAVSLPEKLSGIYQVYDQTNSKIVQEAKFDNQLELQINFSQKLKSGIYILKVITDANVFTEKIILNR